MKLKRTYYKSPRIVHPGTTGRRLVGLTLLILAGIAIWQAYQYGRVTGGYDHKAALRMQRQLRERLAEAEQARDRLTARTTRLEAAAKIDKASLQQVRDEIGRFQQRLSALGKELDFYKGLARDSSYSGVQIRDLSLQRGKDGKPRFRLDLVQLKVGARKLNGRLRMEIVGTNSDGRQITLNGPQPKVSLKNLQELEGRVDLPEGFAPERLNLYVYPKGAKRPVLAETHDWASLLAKE